MTTFAGTIALAQELIKEVNNIGDIIGVAKVSEGPNEFDKLVADDNMFLQEFNARYPQRS